MQRLVMGFWVAGLALALSACAQPGVPSASTAGVSGSDAARYTLQDAPVPQTDLEDAILERINTERQQSGLAPVAFSPDMQRLAREHSLDMVTRHYFGHTDLDGREPYARMQSSGIPFRSFGETESKRPVGGNTVEDVITDWHMHPYGENYMLSENFTEAGVGVYQGDDHQYYITVEYRRP